MRRHMSNTACRCPVGPPSGAHGCRRQYLNLAAMLRRSFLNVEKPGFEFKLILAVS